MAAPNISLLGATYPAVAGVTLPKQGGGTATFPWVEGSETKTANGTYDVTNLAELVVNVAGGGGSGLVYETGEYKPSSNVAQPTINFANTHSDRPFAVLIMDAGGSSVTQTDSALYWVIASFYDAFGVGVYYNTISQYYAVVRYSYKTSGGASAGGNNVTSLSSTSSSGMEYHLSNTSFKPYVGSTSRYFRSGRTYKWIAVWKPTIQGG